MKKIGVSFIASLMIGMFAELVNPTETEMRQAKEASHQLARLLPQANHELVLTKRK